MIFFEKLLYRFFILFLLYFINTSCQSKKKGSVKQKIVVETITKSDSITHENKSENYLAIPDSISELSIRMVGDLMCHKPQSNNALKSDGTFDFTESFHAVKPYLSEADLTIGNLETTMAGTKHPFSGYPAFNSPDAYIQALKECGFDFLVTSNNHSMDTGEEGLLRTLEVIKKNKLSYAGTYTSQTDRDSIRILNLQKIKLAILNYTYGTNGRYPKKEESYLLNIIDSASIYNDVTKAFKKGAEIVLVFYHFGIENKAEPTEEQLKAVKWARDAGARLIIGAHPHVVGPTQFLYPDSRHKDTAFVAYSLGNFISNQYWRYTDAGVILEISLVKNLRTGLIRIQKCGFMPTWVYRGENSSKKMHIIYPAELAMIPNPLPSHLDSVHIHKMKEAFSDTRLMMNKYHNRLELLKVRK